MDIFEKLKAPFPEGDIEWRAGASTADGSRSLALAYITARAVMDRLDTAVGPANWSDTYLPAPAGGVLCRLSLRIEGEWLAKEDAAENTDFEAVKGGISDALKRAAVKWGIGRYLYNLDAKWVASEKRGKSIVLTEHPKLPDWALPQGKDPVKRGKLAEKVTEIIPGAIESAPEASPVIESSEEHSGVVSSVNPDVWKPIYRQNIGVIQKETIASIIGVKKISPESIQRWIDDFRPEGIYDTFEWDSEQMKAEAALATLFLLAAKKEAA